MDFNQNYDFIGQQIANFEDNATEANHNFPDVSLIDQIVFGEDYQEEDVLDGNFDNQQGIEFADGPEGDFVDDMMPHYHSDSTHGVDIGNQQGIGFGNGTEKVLVDDLEFNKYHQVNLDEARFDDSQVMEYVTGREEVFMDDLEFAEHNQSNSMNGTTIEEYQEIEYVTEEVPMDNMVQVDHYQSNSMSGYDFAPTQYARYNPYFTPRELYLQQQVKNSNRKVATLQTQVSKLNGIIEKFQNESRKKDRAMQQASRRLPWNRPCSGHQNQKFSVSPDVQNQYEPPIPEIMPFDKALKIWKDFNRKFPVPRDIIHLDLHIYLFDPNSHQDAPQIKRRLTTWYQLCRNFTGEHQGQIPSEKKKWENYHQKLSYLQDKQEEAGLIRALTVSEKETERKWKTAVRRAQLGF